MSRPSKVSPHKQTVAQWQEDACSLVSSITEPPATGNPGVDRVRSANLALTVTMAKGCINDHNVASLLFKEYTKIKEENAALEAVGAKVDDVITFN